MIMDDRDEVRARAHEAADEAAHSATADKAKGHVKEAVGKVKEKVGGAVGDDKLETKGTVQRLEGKKDRLKGEIKDAIDDVKGKIEAGVEVVKEKLHEARDKK
jgi:uncharacterized protein YjbJ (UPF0337 family)